MKHYRTVSKDFSRTWRRNKAYTFPELRWLARRRGLDIRRHKKRIQLTGPRGELTWFDEVPDAQAPVRPSERTVALAALKLPAPHI